MAYDQLDEYNRMVDVLNTEYNRLKDKNADGHGNEPSVLNTNSLHRSVDENVLDPIGVRPKGCGINLAAGTPRVRRRPPTCSKCGILGHNKRCCPNLTNVPATEVMSTPVRGDEENEVDVDILNTPTLSP